MTRRPVALAVAVTTLVAACAAALAAETRVTDLVSIGPVSVDGPDPMNFGDTSADGRRVFFITSERLVPEDTDTHGDVYERFGNTTTLLSLPTGADDPTDYEADFAGASADGTKVWFETQEKMTADDTDANLGDVYERSGGQTTLISKEDGVPNADFEEAQFRDASKDGTKVFFHTQNKLTAADTDTQRTDAYRRSGGQTTLISTTTDGGPVADPDSDTATISFRGVSDDGNRVYFQSRQNLVGTADVDGTGNDVFLREGTTTSFVTTTNSGLADPGTDANINLDGASRDGAIAIFSTTQPMNVADGDSLEDVFQRSGTATTLVSAVQGTPTDPTDHLSQSDDASRDGTRVFFSTVQQMTEDDTDDDEDVFMRSGGVTTLLTRAAPGVPEPDIAFVTGDASTDGSRFWFHTTARLVPEDNDGGDQDVYEAMGGTVSLVSAPTGVPDPGDAGAEIAGASADGLHVFFHTNQRLVPEDNDGGLQDVYDRFAGETNLITRAGGVAEPTTGLAQFAADFGPDDVAGNLVHFVSDQPFTTADTDNEFDIYSSLLPEPPAPPLVPGGPAGAGPIAGTDRVRPSMTGVRADPATSHLGTQLARFTQRRRRIPTGTRIRFRLSEAARVTLSFAQGRPGRRVGRRCRRPSRRNRNRRPCTRFVRVRPAVTGNGEVGANTVRFQGRLSRRRTLRPGRYELTLTAVDAAGNRSLPRRVRLRFLPRLRRR